MGRVTSGLFRVLLPSLGVFFLWFSSAGGEEKDLASTHFPIPKTIRPQVDFWKKVFAVYSRYQVVIHDTETMQIYRVLDFRRLRDDEELDEEKAATIEDPADDPETAIQKKDKSEILRKCLTSLSPEHREIVDLVYYHERSVEEVAEIVGIPENTVKTRMFYARKKLATLLQAAGIDREWP